MKNQSTVDAYLDYSADLLQRMRIPEEITEADLEQGNRFWQACFDDGWTIEELDEAYYQRFGYRAERSIR